MRISFAPLYRRVSSLIVTIKFIMIAENLYPLWIVGVPISDLREFAFVMESRGENYAY